jgi:hypothetical protein
MLTVRGALSIGAGGLFAFFCVFSWLVPVFVSPHEPTDGDQLAVVRRFGPLGLLAFCLLQLLYSSGEKAVVAFTPPETNFLIAGPFSRRQLLGYKVMVNFLSLLVAAIFFLFWFAYLRVSVSLLGVRYVGLVLALVFVQLFSMSLGFIAATIGATAYNRTRKLLLVGIIALVALGLYRAGGDYFTSDFGTMIERLEDTPVLRTLLEPLRCFSRALAADRLWPDFAIWGSLSLAIDLGLLVLVFALDAWQIEAAAAAGERLYAQVQRVRRGGAAAVVVGGAGKRRFSMPNLPWLFGAGPIAWRQLSAVPRSRSALVIIILLIPLVIIPVTRGTQLTTEAGPAMSMMLAIQVFAMSFFLTPLVAFDFRGDIERFEILKTLPLAPWALVVGELLTPVLFLCLVQWIDLAVIAATLDRPGMLRGVLLAAVLSVPLNFFLIGVDNLLFLIFPTRLVATVGDFQVYGRQLLLQMAKLVCLVVAGGLSAALAAGAYFLFGRSLAVAGAVAAIALTCFAAGLVPVTAMAFQRFDVTRDTPA